MSMYGSEEESYDDTCQAIDMLWYIIETIMNKALKAPRKIGQVIERHYSAIRRHDFKYPP